MTERSVENTVENRKNMKENMIEAIQVTKTFGSHKALDQVNM